MTQEAFKTWWYNEGSQAPYTHHDCEEHTMRMCEIAWANGAYKALAEHAMSEVQRLGQEIEQEPVAHCEAGPEYCLQCKLEDRSIVLVAAVRYIKNNTPQLVSDEICMALATPPQRTWVELTDEDRNDCLVEADPCECLATPEAQELMRCVEAKLKELNHGK